MASANKDEEEKIQEQSSDNAVQKDDAWTQLLFDYHKAILSTWDFAIDMGANWLKAQARMWSETISGPYTDRQEKSIAAKSRSLQ